MGQPQSTAVLDFRPINQQSPAMLESRFTYEASRGETGLKKFAATGHHFAFVFVNKEDGIRYNGPRKVGPTAVTLPRLGEPAPRRDKRFYSTDTLGAYLPALAPNHFVSSLCTRVTQNKFVGHVKVLRSPDPHASVGLVDNQTIVRYRAWFGHDDPYVPKAPSHRSSSVFKRVPDHGVTNRSESTPPQ